MGVYEASVLLLAGSGVGVVAGLFGVGGSFLLVPLLSLLLNVPIEILVGSCACQVLGPATAACLSYRLRARDLRVPLILLGGIVSGTLLGADWLEQARHSWGETRLTGLVQGLYLIMMWGLGLFSWWESQQHRRGNWIPLGWLNFPWLKPTCTIFGRNRAQQVSLISLSGFGLLVGVMSGFLGLSGGVVLVPGLHFLFGIPTKRSARISMLLVAFIAVQAICIHASYDRIDLGLVALLLVGGTIGAQIGTQLAERATGGELRETFAWLLLVAAVLLTVTTWLRGENPPSVLPFGVSKLCPGSCLSELPSGSKTRNHEQVESNESRTTDSTARGRCSSLLRTISKPSFRLFRCFSSF